ncbi:MAG: phosphatase PAP2 family protein [Candidatus Pacebacteria bacterium]|nr:phosphatase PAP2 family protein [Candidatus Paceibacterota bacterium]MDD3728716.1 phosphatase PAP2 family protein [Candidatus Paceibacterota bacterium]MDD4201426.1 phosphatase PAP2 family protein [Candidatus Paceibacterota bacterium]MDD5445720.1 phosphatase PAP2 family protein [Candidatus Paceibacterota bacterium]
MDYYFFRIINDLSGNSFTFDFLALFFGKYFGYFLLFLLFLFLLRNKKRIFFFALSSAILSRFVITTVIRNFYYKDRPFVVLDIFPLIEHAKTASFPSGHAAFFFGLGTAVFLKNKKMGIFFLAGAFLISLSRIYAGIHWPFDIIMGAIVGILSAFIILKIENYCFSKKENK